MNAEEAHLPQHRLVSVLQQNFTEVKSAWGKMTLQQMIAHFADSVRIASGKILFAEIITPPEQLDRLHDLNFEQDFLFCINLHCIM